MQLAVRLAEGGFNGGRMAATSKDEAEVAVPFGQGDDGVIKGGSDFDAFDEGNGRGFFHTPYLFQQASFGNRNHHHATRLPLALDALDFQANCLSQD